MFCFRITDIREVKGDRGKDRFRIEFEVLNWSNKPASGVYISLNTSSGGTVSRRAPFFRDASTDADGRPLEKIDVNGDGVIDALDNEDNNADGILDPGEDQNVNGRLDNDLMPGNLNRPNDWDVVPDPSPTALEFLGGTAVPNIDLLGPPTITQGNPAIGFYDPANPETVDNGANVLDGFVVEVDDFDVGEILSFNWFLTRDNGTTPIGTARQGNSYGFGTVNIARTDGGPPPPPVFAGNTGFVQTRNIFFDSVYKVPDPAEFAAEFGATITAPFLNFGDNKLCSAANVGNTYLEAPPLNRLTNISRRATLRGADATFTARAPCPGVIGARVTRNGVVLGTARTTVSRGGSVSFVVRLQGSAAEGLRRKRSFHVVLATRFTPRNGTEGPTVARTVRVVKSKAGLVASPSVVRLGGSYTLRGSGWEVSRFCSRTVTLRSSRGAALGSPRISSNGKFTVRKQVSRQIRRGIYVITARQQCRLSTTVRTARITVV